MQKHFYRPSHFILLLVLVIFHSGNHLLSTPLNYYPLPPYVGARALAYFYYYISHITTWINFFMRRRPKKLPLACNQNSWEAKEPNQSLPFSPPFCDRPPTADWLGTGAINRNGGNERSQSVTPRDGTESAMSAADSQAGMQGNWSNQINGCLPLTRHISHDHTTATFCPLVRCCVIHTTHTIQLLQDKHSVAVCGKCGLFGKWIFHLICTTRWWWR